MRVLVSWSSGKDCAWALHLLKQQPDVEIVGLLTTINAEFDRVAMHGTRRAILEAQAAAADLPLWKVPLPWPCSNSDYEQRMAEVCTRAVATVSASGLVTAVTVGTATITATADGKSGSATMTVKDGGLVGAAGGTVSAALPRRATG